MPLGGAEVGPGVGGVTRGERGPSGLDCFQAVHLRRSRVRVHREFGLQRHQAVADGVGPALEAVRFGLLVLLLVLAPEPGAQREEPEQDENGNAQDDQEDHDARSAARARLSRSGGRLGGRPRRYPKLRDRVDPVREDPVGVVPAVLHGGAREGAGLVGDHLRQVVAVGREALGGRHADDVRTRGAQVVVDLLQELRRSTELLGLVVVDQDQVDGLARLPDLRSELRRLLRCDGRRSGLVDVHRVAPEAVRHHLGVVVGFARRSGHGAEENQQAQGGSAKERRYSM